MSDEQLESNELASKMGQNKLSNAGIAGVSTMPKLDSLKALWHYSYTDIHSVSSVERIV